MGKCERARFDGFQWRFKVIKEEGYV
ncbi:unnamed protein product, partial [Rotaria sp. Silwood1]